MTSTYAVVDIEGSRTTVEPGSPLRASVNTRVIRAATSVEGWPFQSTTIPIWGSDRSGTASRDSARRETSPASATRTARPMTKRA